MWIKAISIFRKSYESRSHKAQRVKFATRVSFLQRMGGRGNCNKRALLMSG
jgi:hypothetical protein